MSDWTQQDRDAGLGTTRLEGRRVTEYDANMAITIVERLAEGELLKDICARDSGMPSKTTFMKWVSRVPELAQAYMAARELSAMGFEEEAIEVGRNTHKSPGTAQQVSAANLLISQLRWSASRRDPKQFGDRAQTQITVPIHITTSLDMGGGAGSIAEIPDIYTIEAVPNEPPSIAPTTGRVYGPTKQQLVPLIPMDAETKLKPKRVRKRNPFDSALNPEPEVPDGKPV